MLAIAVKVNTRPMATLSMPRRWDNCRGRVASSAAARAAPMPMAPA